MVSKRLKPAAGQNSVALDPSYLRISAKATWRQEQAHAAATCPVPRPSARGIHSLHARASSAAEHN